MSAPLDLSRLGTAKPTMSRIAPFLGGLTAAIPAEARSYGQLLLKIGYFLALFRKKPKSLVPPSQIYIKRRRHLFSLALPLQTLQLVHGPVELPVQMRFVAEKFVRCVLSGQTEAPSFSFLLELCALL